MQAIDSDEEKAGCRLGRKERKLAGLRSMMPPRSTLPTRWVKLQLMPSAKQQRKVRSGKYANRLL